MVKTPALTEARERLVKLDQAHGEYQDSMIAEFEKRLDVIIEKASASVLDAIEEDLVVNDKGVLSGLANRRWLGNVDTMFRRAMKEEGYDRLAAAFVQQFPGQLPLLTKTLAHLSKALGTNFAAGKLLNPSDIEQLANQQRQTLESLRQTVAEVGVLAKQRALAKYNGLRPSQLQRILEKTFEISSGRARTLAATGMSIWYRQATALSLAKIEKETPLSYTYDGPNDSLTRPFCESLKLAMGQGKTWTRQEIDAMTNGQLPNVFESCGGFNCRHQWRIALTEDSHSDFKRNAKLAGGGLLTPGEVPAFTRQSVIKGTYAHKTIAPAKLLSTGIKYDFVPPNAPFGAGFYATSMSGDSGGTVQVAFNVARPLAGSWDDVKAKVSAISGDLDSGLGPQARARELRRALLREGYDGIVATRANGQRMVVGLKKGSAAMIEPAPVSK